MHMKVPSTTLIRFANLPSLVFLGKNEVGYFLDRPRISHDMFPSAEIIIR
jgi:hypothetical protein